MITAYGDAFVEVNRERRQASLILLPETLADWPVRSFDELAREHLAMLVEYRPALILLGTGSRHRFPHPDLVPRPDRRRHRPGNT